MGSGMGVRHERGERENGVEGEGEQLTIGRMVAIALSPSNDMVVVATAEVVVVGPRQIVRRYEIGSKAH